MSKQKEVSCSHRVYEYLSGKKDGYTFTNKQLCGLLEEHPSRVSAVTSTIAKNKGLHIVDRVRGEHTYELNSKVFDRILAKRKFKCKPKDYTRDSYTPTESKGTPYRYLEDRVSELEYTVATLKDALKGLASL